MSPTQAQLATLLPTLEARARQANSLAELSFSMANDSYALLAFRQALVVQAQPGVGTVLAVSGLAKPEEDSPYLLWLKRNWRWLQAYMLDRTGWITLAQLQQSPPDQPAPPDDLLSGWQEWWPAGIYSLPVRRRSGEILGWLCFLLDEPPPAAAEQALQRLQQSWGYCWEMMAGRPRKGVRQRWRQLGHKRWLVYVLLLGVLLVPVRQSVLAPAEIIALDAQVVAAPLDGVISQIQVAPNQAVAAGDVLFSLDKTVLQSRLQVAQQSVAVAAAELKAATYRAFDDNRSKGEIALLQGRVEERRAELAAVQEQLSRTDVTAAHAGIAVFADANDWRGRPVRTGERIMLLADPAAAGMLIHLPVADAIALEPGAPVTLFLTVAPLQPLAGQVIQTSYQALPSPQGISSYRLRASFTQEAALARIGLRGTAKLYGESVPLGYYLLRRPLATLREWSGW